VASEQDRQRAEQTFMRQQRATDAQRPVSSYEIQARTTRDKIARLKALRLAQEAAEHPKRGK